MIEVQELTVRYKSLLALNKISLLVKKGETLAIVGQNGAGKSSLLKVLTGLIKPQEGSVCISGSIGWMPELSTPDPLLKVEEFISFAGYLKGLSNEEIVIERECILKECELIEKKDSLCGTLSKGQKQRVILASALMGSPDILILDEPSSGLDPLFQTRMISLIAEVASTKTVIISTHNISEIERLASRVIVLKEGQISFDGTLEGNSRSYYEYF